ncbi:MAG: hypothetical protein LBF97_04915 [Elusimicrobiota bacterium]|jgi:hypothetical protein|nr:hypothetical protein [Elusimicrobiota bacterium]
MKIGIFYRLIIYWIIIITFFMLLKKDEKKDIVSDNNTSIYKIAKSINGIINGNKKNIRNN